MRFENHSLKEVKLKYKNHSVQQSDEEKYLGVLLDQNLTYHQVEEIRRQMACGIKTMYALRSFSSKKLDYFL